MSTISPAPPAAHLTNFPLFFQTVEQRTALARQQFFEQGARPSGLVSDEVIQSWLRCCTRHEAPGKALSFDPVTRSRIHLALTRNRGLLEVAKADIQALEAFLAGTDCRVLLTDGQGLLLHATQQPYASEQPLLKIATRVGVNLAENCIGTTAPGIVIKTQTACAVVGGEHFFDCLQSIQCAAAPIRDRQGKLAAVLDVSVESGRFGFDAVAVVSMYATAIENRLLLAQSDEHLILHFQANPGLIDTPVEALAGITSDGRVAWLNGVAQRLLGEQGRGQQPDAERLFNIQFLQLMAMMRAPQAHTLRLPNGLSVWAKVRLQCADGVDFMHAVPVAALTPQAAPLPQAPAPREVSQPATALDPLPETPKATLEKRSRHWIDSTLAECGGNVSKAARTLGVSRGLLYRHLQAASANSANAGEPPPR